MSRSENKKVAHRSHRASRDTPDCKMEKRRRVSTAPHLDGAARLGGMLIDSRHLGVEPRVDAVAPVGLSGGQRQQAVLPEEGALQGAVAGVCWRWGQVRVGVKPLWHTSNPPSFNSTWVRLASQPANSALLYHCVTPQACRRQSAHRTSWVMISSAWLTASDQDRSPLARLLRIIAPAAGQQVECSGAGAGQARNGLGAPSHVGNRGCRRLRWHLAGRPATSCRSAMHPHGLDCQAVSMLSSASLKPMHPPQNHLPYLLAPAAPAWYTAVRQHCRWLRTSASGG